MPYAFKNSGLIFGTVATCFVAIIVTHTTALLVSFIDLIDLRSSGTARNFLRNELSFEFVPDRQKYCKKSTRKVFATATKRIHSILQD